MSSHKISRIIVLFQVYGVITLRSSTLSVCWTLVSSVLAIATICKAYTERYLNFNLAIVSGQTQLFNYLFLFVLRILIFISSILNADKFQQILSAFESFDVRLREKSGIEVNSKKRFMRLSLKIVIIGGMAVSSYLSSLTFPRVRKHFAILAIISVHVNHVKALSFLFFVDSLNFRMESLITSSKSIGIKETLKLHSKLFAVSTLIKQCNRILTLTILQNCYSLLLNSFLLSVTLFKLEFTVPISRKFKTQALYQRPKMQYIYRRKHHVIHSTSFDSDKVH